MANVDTIAHVCPAWCIDHLVDTDPGAAFHLGRLRSISTTFGVYAVNIERLDDVGARPCPVSVRLEAPDETALTTREARGLALALLAAAEEAEL
jgi:hypothetical protein